MHEIFLADLISFVFIFFCVLRKVDVFFVFSVTVHFENEYQCLKSVIEVPHGKPQAAAVSSPDPNAFAAASQTESGLRQSHSCRANTSPGCRDMNEI